MHKQKTIFNIKKTLFLTLLFSVCAARRPPYKERVVNSQRKKESVGDRHGRRKRKRYLATVRREEGLVVVMEPAHLTPNVRNWDEDAAGRKRAGAVEGKVAVAV